MMTVSQNLSELLGRARTGDTNARAQLLESVRSYLKLLARLQLDKRLQRKVSESDLVQDVLMQADIDFLSFRGNTHSELLAWFRGILAHSAANLIRHYRHTRKRTIDLEESLREQLDNSAARLQHVPMAPDASPSQQAVRREEVIQLADAMDRLPQEYRDVIMLRHIQGMSMPEVASEMERSLDSVRKLWARALVKLRKDLA